MSSAWMNQKNIDDRDDYEMLWQRLLSEAVTARGKESSEPISDDEAKAMVEKAQTEAGKAIYGE